MSRPAAASLAMLALVLSGCAALGPIASPVATEVRTVSPVADATKTLTVKDGMVFYDRDASHGIRFPPGIYTLEAQDASYWYPRAPSPLERREFRSGQVSQSGAAPGGLMIGKSTLGTVVLPAAGYTDGENGDKVLIWKLGGEFVRLEGKYWSKSF